jgi:ABC-type uncharacterized transport system permease subunit
MGKERLNGILLFAGVVVVAGTSGSLDGNPRLGMITGLGVGAAFAGLHLLRPLSG